MTWPRRRFVEVAVAGLAGGCASLVATPVAPVDGKVTLFLPDWPNLSRPGGSARLRVGRDNTIVYVLALENGEYVAVSPVCKHRGCTVEIQPDRLACPCHGSQYERDGTVLRGPTRAPLDRFATSVTRGTYLVIEVRG